MVGLYLVDFLCELNSYAGTYAANCVYDYSEPTVYQTGVLNKKIIRSRRSTTYYVEVAPWGHHFDKEEISVSKVHFEEFEICSNVNIDLKKGLLNIPWST
jgi:hypothetical protein